MRYAAAKAPHQTSERNCIKILSDAWVGLRLRIYNFAILMRWCRRSLHSQLLQLPKIMGSEPPPSRGTLY
jgi:hypothetical protein